MMHSRHGSAVVSQPNDLDLVFKRDFDAPVELVFDVLTQPEHVTKWFFDRPLAVCTAELRVGGSYHYVGVLDDGREMVFRGTFLELEPPTRLVDTWVFEGRPQDEAVETVELMEAGGVTTVTNTLTFRDRAARDRMTVHGFDGIQESYDRVEDLLGSLLT